MTPATGRAMASDHRLKPVCWSTLPKRASCVCDGAMGTGHASGSPSIPPKPNTIKTEKPGVLKVHPYLKEFWQETELGTECVITRYHDTNANLRTQLLRIVRRAAVAHWPRLFYNLRASFATDLAARFPVYGFVTGAATRKLSPRIITCRLPTSISQQLLGKSGAPHSMGCPKVTQ